VKTASIRQFLLGFVRRFCNVRAMPAHEWIPEPITIIQRFEQAVSNPDAGALVMWALWSVESLHYLQDIHRDFDRTRKAVGGYPPDMVDVAHVRWAAGTAVTALDLCAAAFARAFCAHTGAYDKSMP
jgi:hypothetical protein